MALLLLSYLVAVVPSHADSECLATAALTPDVAHVSLGDPLFVAPKLTPPNEREPLVRLLAQRPTWR